MKAAGAALPLWLALAGAAQGETLYVTDVLRLGLHRAQDTSDSPFVSLVSGTALEVLERTSAHARVRTADGKEGWAKSAYLVAEPPARARLLELEAEAARWREAAEAAEATRAAAAAELQGIAKRAAAADATAAAVARLREEHSAYAQRLESHARSVPLGWAAAAFVLAAVAGFAAGIWWLDSAIRRRHGGLRVY